MAEGNGALISRPTAVQLGFVAPRVTMPHGMEDVPAGMIGLRPAEMQIVHAKRKRSDVGEPGQLKIGKDVYDDVTVVFIRAHPYRVLIEGENEDAKATCASSNGREPHEGVPHPKSAKCGTVTPAGEFRAVCPYSKWTRHEGAEKGTPPPCGEGWVMLGVRPGEANKPFWFATKKTGAIETRQFLADICNLPGDPGLDQLIVRVSTKEMTGKSRGVVWYVPVFTVVERVAEQERGAYHEMAEMVRTLFYSPRIRGADEEKTDTAPDIEVAPDQPPAAADADDADIPF